MESNILQTRDKQMKFSLNSFILSFALITYSNNISPKNIGLCIVATQQYITFLKPLIESARKNFLNNHSLKFFVFSDQNIENEEDIKVIKFPNHPWPHPTLKRFEAFYDNSHEFDKCDYIFSIDVDMIIEDKIKDNILGDLVGVKHPGYYDIKNKEAFTTETNKKSTAYIEDKNAMKGYFAGGFYGGSKKHFIKLVKTCSKNITQDLENGITAIWHDESHLNKYFLSHPPKKVLSPAYCTPEGSQLPFESKIIALLKRHKSIRLHEFPIVVVVASYNNKNYYKKNLRSIFNQKYSNYRVIYIDDKSTDGTKELVKNYAKKHKQLQRFTFIENNNRQLALANIYNAVLSCNGDEIVALVDGDDSLASNDVFEYLNHLYSIKNILENNIYIYVMFFY